MDPSSDGQWFEEPHTSYRSFVQRGVDVFEPTDSTLVSGTMPKSSMDSLGDDLQWTATTSDNHHSMAAQSIERCFLDTVVQLPSSETSMVCSIALSLIFRHNRKGLSMAELQKTLQPGMRTPSGTSEECRIEDSVLFKVLAYIST